MSTDTLMGIQEVAAYLKINQATAYHWAQAGRLPGIKIGRIWRFRRSDIDAWLDKKMYQAVVSPNDHEQTGADRDTNT